MKKYVALLSALALLLCLLTACGSGGSTSTPTPTSTAAATPAADAETPVVPEEDHDPIELSLAIFHAESSLDATEFIIPWLDEITAKCAEIGYDVTFDVYWSETLCAVPDSYQTVLNGTADMSMFLPAMTGLFVLEEVVFFPQNGGDGDLANGTRLIQDLYFAFPEIQEEWTDVQLVALIMETPQYMMTNKNFATFAESKGMMYNTTGSICTSILDKFGWGSVSCGPGDVYSYLERNMMDGCPSSAKNIMSNAWYEVADYIIDFVMTYMYEGIIMNSGVWNSLPAEVQDVFNKMGNTSDPDNYYLADMYDSALNKIEAEYRDKLTSEHGMEWVELPDDTVAEMQALVDEVADEWAAGLDGKGLPGTELLAKYYELIAKYSA